MFTTIMQSPAFWGATGALIYAAPKFLLCLRESSITKSGWRSCLIESCIAVFVGMGAAGAFSPWIGAYLNAAKDHDTRAIAAIVGMLANPLTPRLVKVFGDGTVGAIKKWLPSGDDSNG